MSKIQLELGGKYSAGEMFKRANDDLKAFGRTNKDAIKASTDSLKELEKGFGEDLSKSIGTAKGVLQGLAQGGIWGAIGAAAGAAISMVVDWFKKAKEEAQHMSEVCGEYVTNSIKKIGDTFKQTTVDITAAKQEIQDFASIAQGATINAANAQIHKLHIETLQKITDNMSETGRRVVLADESLEAAKIKQKMTAELSAQKEEAQQKKIEQTQNALQAAQIRLSQVEMEKCNVSKHENEVIQEYARLKAQEMDITSRYKDNQMTADYAARRLKEVQEKLSDILETNKGTIDANQVAVEALSQAQADVTAATRNLEHEQRNLTLVQQQNNDALLTAQTAVENATQAKKDAELADKKYTEKVAETTQKEAQREAEKQAAHSRRLQAEIEAAEIAEAEAMERKQNSLSALRECWMLKLDEARFLRIYNQELINGCEHEEALTNAKRLCAEQMKNEAEIVKKCKDAKIEEKDFINRYNDLLSKGFDAAEAYARVQKELNDQLKERKDAEKKATQEAKDSLSDTPQGKAKKTEMVVSLSSSAMGDIGEKVESKFSFKDWQKKMREEQRKIRDAKNNIKVDQPKMVKALKGEMPEEEARQWMEYAKKKYTPDQMRELGKLAMNNELLSKKEQRAQARHIEQMAKEIAKSLTIK